MKNLEKGITLVEIVVVLFIIAMFMVILISDFPKMLRQLALSRATYNFAQDLRKTQDLGLSGIALNNANGNAIVVKGYGIYVTNSDTKYLIYADVAEAEDENGVRSGNQQYGGNFDTYFCESQEYVSTSQEDDCIIKMVDIKDENSRLSIKDITNTQGTSYSFVSINFSPPSPKTTITTDVGEISATSVVLQNTDSVERGVLVNSSGLIDIQ
ncbi:MAG: type II secretion system protein [Candidatus Staskawiczbacteria bacterium]|jgi:type II secretory pathway pseudopilin PulG